MILIAKPSLARKTADMLKKATQDLSCKGVVVRTASVLGDRIMNNAARGVDKNYYLVGRYIQVLVDCAPSMLPVVRNNLMASRESIRDYNHRLPDILKEAQKVNSKSEEIEDQRTRLIFAKEEQNIIDAIARGLKNTKSVFN